MNKSIIYLLYFTFYTILILWFGKFGFDRVKNIRDFYVAGNSLGLFTSICTFGGTWFSAASMLGLTGSLYVFGYSSVLYSVIPWFLGALLIVILSGKFKEYSIVTIPEFFRIRYNSQLLQAMGGFIIIIGYILYIVIQIRGFGIVMTRLLNIPYTLSIFLVYLFILYTTFGGLYSVARTDAVNFILIILGSAAAALFILTEVGGITAMHEGAAAINSEALKGSGFYTPKGAMLDPFTKGLQPPILLGTSFFGWGLGLATNPQYAIRIISAKDRRTASSMIGITVLVLMVIYCSCIIIGIGSRVLIPTAQGIASVDEIFPYIIENVIDSPFSGFILISIIAAAISTANSQLLILASGFCYDIYKNVINRDINEEKFLNLNRILICIGGTLSLTLAIKPPEGLLVFGGHIWGIFASTFLLPLFGGVFWQKATREGAIGSFIGGLAAYMTFYLLKIGYVEFNPLSRDYIIHPALPGVLTSGIFFITISLLTDNLKKA